VTLSNQSTPNVVAAALERDVDVFTEKPAARTASDLQPLLDAEADSDATVCVSYPWRASNRPRDQRRVESGFFGDPRSFDARFFASKVAHRDADHYLFDQTASRGGIHQWLGIHWLDLFEWLFDDPIVQVSATTVLGDPSIDGEDAGTVLFETASGAVGSLRAGSGGSRSSSGSSTPVSRQTPRFPSGCRTHRCASSARRHLSSRRHRPVGWRRRDDRSVLEADFFRSADESVVGRVIVEESIPIDVDPTECLVARGDPSSAIECHRDSEEEIRPVE